MAERSAFRGQKSVVSGQPGDGFQVVQSLRGEGLEIGVGRWEMEVRSPESWVRGLWSVVCGLKSMV